MSGKLDQSLDEIVSSHRRSGTRTRARRSIPNGKQTTKVASAPVGGVKKSMRPLKGTSKGVPTGPSGAVGESKVLISNLPKDVNEQQIKEYFVSTVGAIKRVDLSYGPGGISRGNATITFHRPDAATKAIKVANGIQIDGKAIKVDIILDAVHAAAIPAPRGLSERITTPKAHPKSAAITRTPATNNARGGRGKPRAGRTARPARPAKKTAEQLDSEMADYWQTGAAAPEGGAATSGGAAPAANGDAPMDDDVL